MVTTVTAPSGALPEKSTNTLALTFGDTATPPNVFTNTWTFISSVTHPSLSYSLAGGQFTITFTGTLQSADTANGAYVDLTGTNSPAVFTLGVESKFFRARN